MGVLTLSRNTPITISLAPHCEDPNEPLCSRPVHATAGCTIQQISRQRTCHASLFFSIKILLVKIYAFFDSLYRELTNEILEYRARVRARHRRASASGPNISGAKCPMVLNK